jgi:hypothetical protein
MWRSKNIALLGLLLLSQPLFAKTTAQQQVVTGATQAICSALANNNMDEAAELWKFLKDSGLNLDHVDSACASKASQEPEKTHTMAGALSKTALDSCKKKSGVSTATCIDKNFMLIASESLSQSVANDHAKAVSKYLDVLKEIDSRLTPTDKGWGNKNVSSSERNEDFFLSFYGGLEGTSIQSLSEEANVRAGFTAYNQLVRFMPNYSVPIMSKRIASRCSEKTDCGFGLGLHGWLSGVLTSSAEQTIAASSTNLDGTDPTLVEPEVELALESELGVFVPFFAKDLDSYCSLLIGPTFQASLIKVGNADRFTRRYYGGTRLAYSPESFVDVLYGKTEGLSGHRAEIRFQYPLHTLKNGGRIFWGGAFNIGVEGSSQGEIAEPDSVRLYITWNTDIKGIFKR